MTNVVFVRIKTFMFRFARTPEQVARARWHVLRITPRHSTVEPAKAAARTAVGRAALGVRLQGVLSSPAFRTKCLQELSQLGAKHHLSRDDDDSSVVFEVRSADSFLTPCVSGLLAASAVDTQHGMLIVQMPSWAGQLLHAMADEHSILRRVRRSRGKFGPLAPAPTPSVLACALKLWEPSDQGALYHQLSDAIRAAEQLG